MFKKSRLLVCLFSILSVFANSQSSSSTATVITPSYYFDATPTVATFSNQTLVSSSGQVFNSCVGTQSVCWLKFNIPVPGNTTLGTRSIKIEIQGASFTPVIDVFDSSVNWRECVTGSLMKTTPGSNDIIPGNDYYIRISSTVLSVGSTFSIGVQYYPVAEVRAGYYPTSSGDPNGYSICDQYRRNNMAAGGAGYVQATRFYFNPSTSPNSGSCVYEVSGSGPLILLNQISCLCYGINFDVLVEVLVDDHWCGTSLARPLQMQSSGLTSITTPNNSTLAFNNSLSAAFACTGAQYEWEFTSQNGNVVYFQSSSSSVVLDNVDCLRFNRIYQARVRIIHCGITGAWCGIDGEAGTPLTFFTAQIPNIPVPTGQIGNGPTPNNFCFTQVNTNAVVDIAYYAGVDNYIFQFTKVTSTSPFTPVTNPTIIYTTSSLCPISIGGCSAGNTYRVGIMPSVNAEACAPAQQGNYSPWCYFSVNPAPAPVPGMIALPEDVYSDYETFEKSENLETTGLSFEVIGNQYARKLVVSTNDQEISGKGYFNLFDINGRLIYSLEMSNATGVSVIQIDLPQDLPTGIYIAKVYSNNTPQTGKIFLASN